MCVDGFKLSGPASRPREAWDLTLSPSEIARKGIGMDPPTPVGRYLGCERHITEKWVDCKGEDPTVLGPLPPKVKKADYRGGGR